MGGSERPGIEGRVALGPHYRWGCRGPWRYITWPKAMQTRGLGVSPDAASAPIVWLFLRWVCNVVSGSLEQGTSRCDQRRPDWVPDAGGGSWGKVLEDQGPRCGPSTKTPRLELLCAPPAQPAACPLGGGHSRPPFLPPLGGPRPTSGTPVPACHSGGHVPGARGSVSGLCLWGITWAASGGAESGCGAGFGHR